MAVDPLKRKLREQKRAVKKRGNKHRRQQFARDLRENSEEAAHSEERFGRHSSATFNGRQRHRTRDATPLLRNRPKTIEEFGELPGAAHHPGNDPNQRE